MTNTTTTLEQRITARLHESIGDLVTEDDLKAMVARGIENALFSPRNVVTNRGYGAPYQDQRPSVIEENVTLLLKEKMDVAVGVWLTEHPEQIEAALVRAFQDGAANAMLQSLDRRMEGVVPAALRTMQNNGMLPRLGS